MRYNVHIENRHDLQAKDVYVYLDTAQGRFLLKYDGTVYERVPVEPGVDNRANGPTIQLSYEWMDDVLRAWLESEHGHQGSESLLSDRLAIETQRVDKLMDKLLEQL